MPQIEPWKRIKLRDNDIITVCDICIRSCCWHGEFMCDDAVKAGTVDLPVGFLRKLTKHLDHTGCSEHEDYWKQDLWKKRQ